MYSYGQIQNFKCNSLWLAENGLSIRCSSKQHTTWRKQASHTESITTAPNHVRSAERKPLESDERSWKIRSKSTAVCWLSNNSCVFQRHSPSWAVLQLQKQRWSGEKKQSTITQTHTEYLHWVKVNVKNAHLWAVTISWWTTATSKTIIVRLPF